jgi:hypothetical protein
MTPNAIWELLLTQPKALLENVEYSPHLTDLRFANAAAISHLAECHCVSCYRRQGDGNDIRKKFETDFLASLNSLKSHSSVKPCILEIDPAFLFQTLSYTAQLINSGFKSMTLIAIDTFYSQNQSAGKDEKTEGSSEVYDSILAAWQQFLAMLRTRPIDIKLHSPLQEIINIAHSLDIPTNETQQRKKKSRKKQELIIHVYPSLADVPKSCHITHLVGIDLDYKHDLSHIQKSLSLQLNETSMLFLSQQSKLNKRSLLVSSLFTSSEIEKYYPQIVVSQKDVSEQHTNDQKSYDRVKHIWTKIVDHFLKTYPQALTQDNLRHCAEEISAQYDPGLFELYSDMIYRLPAVPHLYTQKLCHQATEVRQLGLFGTLAQMNRSNSDEINAHDDDRKEMPKGMTKR